MTTERYECHLGPVCMEWDVRPHRHVGGVKEYPGHVPASSFSEYPQHDRLHAVVNESQAIGEFIDWLEDEKGYPRLHKFQSLLAEFFGIDQDALEAEKREMLAKQRKLNAEMDAQLAAIKDAR